MFLQNILSRLAGFTWQAGGHSWQDREYVLSWFGDKEVQAKKNYCQYVKEGISHGSVEQQLLEVFFTGPENVVDHSHRPWYSCHKSEFNG